MSWGIAVLNAMSRYFIMPIDQNIKTMVDEIILPCIEDGFQLLRCIFIVKIVPLSLIIPIDQSN